MPGKTLKSAGIAISMVLASATPWALAESVPADAGNPAPIEQIVVVASKSERAVRDIAANVTVLSREDMDVEVATSLADLLRYTPGLEAQGAGNRFGTEGVSIRGIGGNRVAVLLDGVPLSDQFDVGSFANATRDFVDTGFVQRAEVLHGPASALYGSSAIGGVLALRSPQPGDLAGQRSSGGRIATTWRAADASLHGTAMHAISGRRSGLLGGVSLRDGAEQESAAARDNPDRREYQRRAGILKYVIDDTAGNSWQLAWYGQDSEVSSGTRSILGTGRFRSTTALEGDDDYRLDLFTAEYGFGDGDGVVDSGTLRAYHGSTVVSQYTLDERGLARRPVTIDRLFGFEQDVDGLELNLRKTLVGSTVVHELIAGLEYRQRRTEEYRDGLETGLQDGVQTKVLLGEEFPLRDFPVSRSTDFGVFVEDSMSIGRWRVIAALRADRYELDPLDDPMYAEDYPFADPVAVSASDLSPKLGLVYTPTSTVDLYLQYAHGFRAPPYEDANIGLELPAFNYRAIPNPDLASERSDGIDVGLRWHGTRSKAHLSLFRTNYDDFIQSKVRLGEDPVSGRILFQSQNLDEATIEGLEAGWSVLLPGAPGDLSLEGTLYWAQGENHDNGEALNSVGPAQAVLGIDWAPPDARWHVRLLATATAAWNDLDESRGNLFQPDGYAVFDLFVTRSLSARTRLRAAITNLGDREYWAWSEVHGLAPDDPMIPYLARPGRSVSLALDMNW
jgi:hemoglobin/transferrin/lactoferrin receptor protein